MAYFYSNVWDISLHGLIKEVEVYILLTCSTFGERERGKIPKEILFGFHPREYYSSLIQFFNYLIT